MPGILISYSCYHSGDTSLRVCLQPVMDGRLQGYASCAEWHDINWRTKQLYFPFLFFSFFLVTEVRASVFALTPRYHASPPASVQIQYFKEAQSLIRLLFFFPGLSQTLNFREWQFRQFPSQHETDCAHQLWVGDGSKWLPPSELPFFLLCLCKMMRRQATACMCRFLLNLNRGNGSRGICNKAQGRFRSGKKFCNADNVSSTSQCSAHYKLGA